MVEIDKWKRIPILKSLYDLILERFVEPKKYQSVSSFVEIAVREKLDRERRIVN